MPFLHIVLSTPQVLYSSMPNIVKHSLHVCDLIVHSRGLDDLLPPGEVVQVLEGDVGLVAELQPRQAGQRHLHRALEPDTVQIFLNIHGVSVCLFVVTPRRSVVLQTIQTCLIKIFEGGLLTSRRGRAHNNNMGELSGVLSSEERERATSGIDFGNTGRHTIKGSVYFNFT